MVDRHPSQLTWGPAPQTRGAPDNAKAGDWVEPWVGELWAELDLRALLATTGLPVRPVDPDALPVPARDLLAEWAIDWHERRKAATDEG